MPLVGGRVELVTGRMLFECDAVDASSFARALGDAVVVVVLLEDAGWLPVEAEPVTLSVSLAVESVLRVSCCVEDDEFKASESSELCVPFTDSVATADIRCVDVGEPSAGFGVCLEFIEDDVVDDSSSVAQVGYAIVDGSKSWSVLLLTELSSRSSCEVLDEVVNEFRRVSTVGSGTSATVLESGWIMLFSVLVVSA